MASTYTTSLQLQKIASGEQSGIWGSSTNTNWDLIEQAVTGVINVDLTGVTTYTLVALNGASDVPRNLVLVFSGTPSATVNVIAPAVNKSYIIQNNCGKQINISATGGTQSVSIPYVTGGSSAQVYCDGQNASGTGIGFYPALTNTGGNLNVSGNLVVTGNETINGIQTVNGTSTLVPPGSLLMWPTNVAPTGYLLCNGGSYTSIGYPNLFAAIGYTFGGSSGTFLVPDYRNRMPIGAGTTAGIAIAGGTADAVIVNHTHDSGTITTGNESTTHSHALSANAIQSQTAGLSGTVGPSILAGTDPVNLTLANGNGHTHNFSFTTQNANGGVSGTNANLPPYLGISFIIKT